MKRKRKNNSEILDEWAKEGLRVLAFAKKETGNLKEKKDFEFLGIVGISDPVRKEAKELIKIAKKSRNFSKNCHR